MEYAQVLMDCPEGSAADGSLIVLIAGLEWQNVPFVNPTECEHQESMCRECIEVWDIDYAIRLPGIAYVF